MKICRNCGAQMQEDERFCPICGFGSAPNEQPIVVEKKRNKKLLLVVLGILVIAAAVAFIIKPSNPVDQIRKAADKTLQASSFDFSFAYSESSYDTPSMIEGAMEIDIEEHSLKISAQKEAEDGEIDEIAFVYEDWKGTVYRYNPRSEEWYAEEIGPLACVYIEQLLELLENRADPDIEALVKLFAIEDYVNADEVIPTFEKIVSELTTGKNLKETLGYTKESSGDGKTYRFKPDLAKALDIVVENMEPVFADGDVYDEMCDEYEDICSGLEDFNKPSISFTIKNGYLSAMEFRLEDLNGNGLEFSIVLDNFNNAIADIPDAD